MYFKSKDFWLGRFTHVQYVESWPSLTHLLWWYTLRCLPFDFLGWVTISKEHVSNKSFLHCNKDYPVFVFSIHKKQNKAKLWVFENKLAVLKESHKALISHQKWTKISQCIFSPQAFIQIWLSYFNFDGTSSNGTDCLPDKVNIHFSSILLELSEYLPDKKERPYKFMVSVSCLWKALYYLLRKIHEMNVYYMKFFYTECRFATSASPM